jgi:uncharacterized protein
MIAVDTNILVYAHRIDAPLHQEAKACISSLRASHTRWALPWPAAHEFIGTITSTRRLPTAAPMAIALNIIECLLAEPNCEFLSEGPGHFEWLQQLATAGRLQGPQIHDARIAAICLSHGVSELWTADRDFSRFPQLRVRNPLVG